MSKSINLQSYLDKEIVCACGRTHKTDLSNVFIEKGAIEKLPKLIRDGGYKKVLMISDVNTYEAAGKQAEEILKREGFSFKNLIFEDSILVPDERAIGKVFVEAGGCDLVIGVGSGTINDLSKFSSSRLGLDYFIVASAPSMDGFASNVAALITNNLKTTYETHTPKAIIGDIDILKNAPLELIAAGICDILGKYVCLLDWRIANLINGEYYCEYIVDIVRNAIEIEAENSSKVASRDEETVKAVMEGLVLTGIAMSFSGNSRPASGSEHHLSHFWEMMFLFKDRAPVPHGIKVGIGTVVSAKLYNSLKNEKIDFEKARENAKQFSLEDWSKIIADIYGPAAPEVIALEKSSMKNGASQVIGRINEIEKKYSDMIKLIDELLPSVDDIIGLIKNAGAPYLPSQENIDDEFVVNSIIYAKELRNRFGLLQMLFDLNLTKKFAELNYN